MCTIIHHDYIHALHNTLLYKFDPLHLPFLVRWLLVYMVLVLDWSSDGSYHFESSKSLEGICSITWRVLWLMEINSFGWKALHDINLSYLTDGASYIYCY